MEPQDQAQITFRSEIHSIVFSVGQEGDCLEERISRSGDFGTIYSVSDLIVQCQTKLVIYFHKIQSMAI